MCIRHSQKFVGKYPVINEISRLSMSVKFPYVKIVKEVDLSFF